MAIIQLSQSLVDQCKKCAQQRDHNRRNSVDYSSDKTDDKGIWSFMGVLGEVALLSYFNLDIDWEYLSTDKGFCGVDVGDIWEVRAMSKFGNRLFLWSDEVLKHNKLAYAWSKVVVDPATGNCTVCGWAMGFEIAMNGVHNQYDCRRSSYFLDNILLRNHSDPKLDQQEATRLHLLYRNLQMDSQL